MNRDHALLMKRADRRKEIIMLVLFAISTGAWLGVGLISSRSLQFVRLLKSVAAKLFACLPCKANVEREGLEFEGTLCFVMSDTVLKLANRAKRTSLGLPEAKSVMLFAFNCCSVRSCDRHVILQRYQMHRVPLRPAVLGLAGHTASFDYGSDQRSFMAADLCTSRLFCYQFECSVSWCTFLKLA